MRSESHGRVEGPDSSLPFEESDKLVGDDVRVPISENESIGRGVECVREGEQVIGKLVLSIESLPLFSRQFLQEEAKRHDQLGENG